MFRLSTPLHQILRHYSPAETDSERSMTPWFVTAYLCQVQNCNNATAVRSMQVSNNSPGWYAVSKQTASSAFHTFEGVNSSMRRLRNDKFSFVYDATAELNFRLHPSLSSLLSAGDLSTSRSGCITNVERILHPFHRTLGEPRASLDNFENRIIFSSGGIRTPYRRRLTWLIPL